MVAIASNGDHHSSLSDHFRHFDEHAVVDTANIDAGWCGMFSDAIDRNHLGDLSSHQNRGGSRLMEADMALMAYKVMHQISAIIAL